MYGAQLPFARLRMSCSEANHSCAVNAHCAGELAQRALHSQIEGLLAALNA